MPGLLSKIPQQLSDFWKGLEKENRNKIVITSIIVFISIVIAVIAMTKPQYQPLFSKQDPKDIGEISEQLEKLNIDYKLQDNGTSVLVKKQQINKAKVALAQTGYPKRGITFEDLNKSSFSATDSERQKRYQAYKESNIEEALKEMENVRDVTVMLSIPEKTAFFNDKEKPAKASVRVDSYQEFTVAQVKSIQRFVAGSIENLDAKDVTILDNNGNMLNEENDQSVAGDVDRQYQIKQLVTKNVERKVTDLLAELSDNIRVMANLELDFDTLITSKEIYEPVVDEKGIIRSYTERKENTDSEGAIGVPGTDTNPPTYPNVAGGSDVGYKLSDKTVNYDINKIVTQSTKEIGKIDKANSSITVAMFHNPEWANNSDNIDIETIKGMVASATGIIAENVIVENLIAGSRSIVKSPTIGFMDWLNTYGAILLVAILIVLIVLAIVWKRSDPYGSEEQNGEYSDIEQLIAKSSESLPDIDLEEKSEFKRQIDKLVKQKPEIAVQMLRTWLAEDWD